jgi:hypothetical protein
MAQTQASGMVVFNHCLKYFTHACRHNLSTHNVRAYQQKDWVSDQCVFEWHLQPKGCLGWGFEGQFSASPLTQGWIAETPLKTEIHL